MQIGTGFSDIKSVVQYVVLSHDETHVDLEGNDEDADYNPEFLNVLKDSARTYNKYKIFI